MPTNNSNYLNKEDLALLEKLQPLANALPTNAIREPDMPVATVLREGASFVQAAREHSAALQAVGMPTKLPNDLEQRYGGLRVAQALWDRQRNKGRDEALTQTINHAYTLRADILAAADLALRNSQDGQRRLDNIREGEGLPDLNLDLLNLAVLVREAREYFVAINADPDEMVKQLETTGAALQQGLANEGAQKSIVIEKEQRDRYYTLCLEPLRELRAFADFAFRKDEGNVRRFAFTSGYTRRAHRRFVNKVKAAAATIDNPTNVAE